MATEGEPHYLTGIYLNLELNTLVLQAAERSVVLRMTERGVALRVLSIDDITAHATDVIDAAAPSSPASEPQAPSDTAAAQAAATEPASSTPTSVLTGRIQGVPVEGKPDRQGHPTAWARFLAHIDGEDGATLLSTTFHGPTRALALGFPPEAQITAQGYLHLRAPQEGRAARLSSLSVIHLLNYPGQKPATSVESES